MFDLYELLTNNAIDYGKKNGFVKVVLSANENFVTIEFVDNGIGIEKKHLDKIWNRFYQADASHSSEGFGLGIFKVDYSVNCHKGKASVTSTVGQGSKFVIIIPK